MPICTIFFRKNNLVKKIMHFMQIVILAGGKATRMYPMSKTIPKSMIEINGKPFLEHQIDLLKKNQITQIVLCVGNLSKKIIDYFGDGKKFGVSIKYSIEEDDNLFGTGGALKNAQSLLNDEFFVMYGDSYLPINFRNIDNYFQKSKKIGLMTVYKNENKFDKSNISTQGDIVSAYDKTGKNQDLKFIDYGLLVFKKKILDFIPSNQQVDLEIPLKQLIKEKSLGFFEVKERFYEIGSLSGIKDFENYIH